MKKIILLAILTYFLIGPLTYHPDTKLTLRYPALNNNKIWDIYGYINTHKLDIPDFHYPPAHYWWLKVHYPISRIIGGKGFDEWLSQGNYQASFTKNVFRYNLAAKFPLLLLGLISGWLIFLIVKKSTKDENKAKMAALFWYFNPVTLYSLVIMGQNDIVAISLFLGGLLFIKKWWLVALSWGFASGIKNYPLIWSILFLLSYEKNIIKLVLKSLSVLFVYGLILLPWLNKSYFIKAVLNSGLSQRMFVASISIGFQKYILIVPLLLVIIGLNAWEKKSFNKMFDACFIIFKSCLVILGFSHFNPQWMLWVIPFLSIWLSIKGWYINNFLPIFIIFCIWILLVLGFDDKFLTWGLFSLVCPNLINFPTLVKYISNKGGDLSQLINFCQSLLAGISLWYITKKYKKNTLIKKNIKLQRWYILIPWLLVMIIIIFLKSFKTEKVYYSENSSKEVLINELINKKWLYNTKSNLKYFEISLNNESGRSRDSGILEISDGYNNKFIKEFSGFNAASNSWLRVDVPNTMSNSKVLQIGLQKLDIKDSLLKVNLDINNRWAINFYNLEKMSWNEILGKFIILWWWWILLGVISFSYTKIKKD